MDKSDLIYVAGHRGLVGSALVRTLKKQGYDNLIVRTSKELDLRDHAATQQFFEENRPSYVFLAAARVGGILANSRYPVEFLLDNLRVQNNVIENSHRIGVKKLLFLGSSCIYPREAAQPITEDALLTGPLEPTNEAYAVAKIAGIKLCEACHRQHGDQFISVMPTNLYGENDNFDLETCHVLPALIRKFHTAKEAGADSVEIWGSGTPYREFLHVDDLADACVFLMRKYAGPELINVGTGKDITIRDVAHLISEVVGFEGELVFDRSRPDGTPRKRLDVSRLSALGWEAPTSLKEGLKLTYQWYCAELKKWAPEEPPCHSRPASRKA